MTFLVDDALSRNELYLGDKGTALTRGGGQDKAGSSHAPGDSG